MFFEWTHGKILLKITWAFRKKNQSEALNQLVFSQKLSKSALYKNLVRVNHWNERFCYPLANLDRVAVTAWIRGTLVHSYLFARKRFIRKFYHLNSDFFHLSFILLKRISQIFGIEFCFLGFVWAKWVLSMKPRLSMKNDIWKARDWTNWRR